MTSYCKMSTRISREPANGVSCANRRVSPSVMKIEKLRLYLESTTFNYYFDADRDGHAETVRLFKDIGEGKYEGYTSGYAITELEDAQEPKRSYMMGLIDKYNIVVLNANYETYRLADRYISEGMLSENHRFDSSHIAVASVYGLDCVVSFNFRHINRIKTKRMTAQINQEEGYEEVIICTPMEVVDYEESEYD